MLRFNAKSGEFFVVASPEDTKRCEEAGLTLSTTAKGPQGQRVYFTDSAYAALPFFRDGDQDAQHRLGPLWDKYQKSWAKDSPNKHPFGQGAKDRGYEPMPYQNAGVDYMLEQDNSILGDAPGLGKSSQALIFDNVKGHEHNLIVCPANVRKSWRNQISLWTTIPGCKTYVIMKGSDGVNPFANYTVVSYDLLRNPGIHQALYQQRFDSIHLDEVHGLKESDVKRSQALFGGGRGLFAKQAIVERAKSVNGLTGTLMPNRPRECRNVVRHLIWQAIDYMGEEEFNNRYNPRGALSNGHMLEAQGRLPELQARLRCNGMVRRLKEDVLTELPDVRYELTYIEPDGAITDILRQEKMLNFKVEDLKNPFAEIWGQISTLRMLMGVASVPRFVEHIRFLLDVAEIPKVTVFAWHREVMDKLAAILEPYGVVEVRGGLSQLRKDQAVDAFVHNPDKRIFLGQLLASGIGIDGLQGVCSHAVVLEPDWVPGNNLQAIDRLHRIGQHDNVIAQLMCVEGSFLERILAANFTKLHGIHASLDEVFAA